MSLEAANFPRQISKTHVILVRLVNNFSHAHARLTVLIDDTLNVGWLYCSCTGHSGQRVPFLVKFPVKEFGVYLSNQKIARVITSTPKIYETAIAPRGYVA